MTLGQGEGSVFVSWRGSLVKKQIKISANAGLVVLLERAVEAFALNKENFVERYGFLLQHKLIDMATCLRYSPVSFGCTIELVEKSVKSVLEDKKESYPICLHDLDSGKRFKITLNSLQISLLQILLLFEGEYSLSIFEKRAGYAPKLEINGNIISPSELAVKKLADVGGKNSLIRLSYVKSAHKIEISREHCENVYLYKEESTPVISTVPHSSPTVSNCNLESQPLTSDYVQREFVYHAQLPHSDPSPESDTDSFYQFTPQEFKQLVSTAHQNTLKRQNAPLMSAKLANLKREEMKRHQFPKGIIRFRFDDCSAIDATFLSTEKVEEIFAFLQHHSSFTPSSVILSVPGQLNDLWEYRNVTIFEAGLIPRALLMVRKRV